MGFVGEWSGWRSGGGGDLVVADFEGKVQLWFGKIRG